MEQKQHKVWNSKNDFTVTLKTNKKQTVWLL